MAICRDESILYLRNLGYNVIRHPRTGIEPLNMIGIQEGEAILLGGLDRLVKDSTATLPRIAAGQIATDIEGQNSSRMKVGIGVSLLGTLIGAMGGTLGADLNYTNARQVSFQFSGVVGDVAEPLAIGAYLAGADVDVGNPILREYVLGNGDLYILYHVVRSDHFDVSFEKSAGVGANVDAGQLVASVGGKVGVDTSGASNGRVRFAGDTKLAFGFKCLQVVLDEGELRLFGVKAGSVALSALSAEDEPVNALIMREPGMVELRSATDAGGVA